MKRYIFPIALKPLVPWRLRVEVGKVRAPASSLPQRNRDPPQASEGAFRSQAADCYLRQGDGGTKTARFGCKTCFLM